MVFLAPAGRHLTFRRGADGVVGPISTCGRSTRRTGPSVDVLFQSAAEVYGAGCSAS